MRRSTSLVSPAVEVLQTIDEWGARTAAAGVVRAGRARRARPARVGAALGLGFEARQRARHARCGGGGCGRPRRAGRPARLDGATPAGARVRSALRGTVPIAPPGRRRIYSNEGFAILGEHVASPGPRCRLPSTCAPPCASRSGSALDPEGHPGAGMHACVSTTCWRSAESCSGRRSWRPRRTPRWCMVQFPGLDGVLPNRPLQPARLGSRRRAEDRKSPHWTGSLDVPPDVRPLRRQRDFPVGRSGLGRRLCVLTTRRVR